MADFTALKATIQQYVKQNGNEEITGAILQDVLLSMVDTMGDGAINTLTQALSDEITARGGADSILQGNIDSLGLSLTALATFVSSGYIFRGIANQSTVPSSLNGKVFYLTSTSGQYSNMGNIMVQAGISALLYDGAAWSAVLLIAMDNAPTEDSGNMVKSGGVYSAIATEAARALAAETKSAEFDSTTKYIIFKNSVGTVLYQMDARAFVIDGMVQDVEIKDVTISGQTVTCLVISFNTDAGKQDINIPLTQIFNPANYYDKTAIDALLLPVTIRLNAGYLYMGLATVSGTPDTSKGKVFYLTATAGTYTNYGNTVVADGLTILSYDGTSWTGTLLKGLDSTPTQNSTNLVTSGGVQNELALGAVYDVSAKNPTAGPNNDGKWESLSALLSDANLNTLIPTSVRKGGMSIKFVRSSDNKYVQYFLTKDEWSLSEADWQKMNLEEEVSQLGQYCYNKIGNPNISINLDSIEKHNGLINDGVWALLNNTSYKHIFLPVKGGQKYRFVAATPYNRIEYAFLTSTTEAEGEAPDFCEGYSDVVTRSAPQYDVLIPDDCNYLYVYAQGGSVITLPTSCTLLASDGSIQEEIDDINSDISSINTAIGDKLSIVEQSLTTPQKETTLNNVGVTDTDSFFDLFETAETGYSAITLNSTISGKFITSNGSLSSYALYDVKVYGVSGIDKVYIKESRSVTEVARIYAFYSDSACTSLVGEVGPEYDSTAINLEINVPSGANYIGVSYREDVTSAYQVLKGDKATLLKTIIRIAESSSQVFGICKISKWYFHFVRKNGGKYIIREFLNEGINNLFFLEAIHIGHITDEGVVIESTIQEAYRTDNIGPVMISNPVLFPGEDGGWSGGAHGKTIDNVEYPTAEQDSLSILCDGVSVSENGMYFGEVTITAKNKLYFPESITGDDLSSATLALNERIEIVLNEKMNVRVIEEAASNDVYISRYYGLQGIRIGFNEMYLLGNNLHITFADMATDLYLSQPERKIMMYNNNLHYDLTLKDIGLGMLNNTSRNYYGFFPVSARKVYFMLIDTYGGVQPYVLESGKVIGWEGIYDVYFD